MSQWFQPQSWGEGVTPPFISIGNPDQSLMAVMPIPVKEFMPEFTGTTLKRAKYTGLIHKPYNYESFEGDLIFEVRADRQILSPYSIPYEGVNELNIFELIHKTDMLIDKMSEAYLEITFHGSSRTELYDEPYADHPHHWYNFRLAEPPKYKNIGIAAYRVTLRIAIDGKASPYPINKISAPRMWRSEP